MTDVLRRHAAVLVAALLVACQSAATPAATLTPTPTASPTASPTATASPTPTASPSPTPGVEAGTYLALGDSLAVGAGATSRDLGYVARLADALPEAQSLVNLGIGGETSTSMIRSGQLADALDTIAAADPPVVLVTLDIGGNDLLRLLGTDACASAPEGPDCRQLLALTLADFEANFRQIITELTGAIDQHAPDARLAVMTYFNPFSGTDAAYEAAAELALLGTDARLDCDADTPAARGMNDLIACIGRDAGAVAADVHPRFAKLGLELTHIGARDIHANDRGYDVIAATFEEALAEDAAQ